MMAMRLPRWEGRIWASVGRMLRIGSGRICGESVRCAVRGGDAIDPGEQELAMRMDHLCRRWVCLVTP